MAELKALISASSVAAMRTKPILMAESHCAMHRTAALRKQHHQAGKPGQGRQWAVLVNGPFLLDFVSLRDLQGIFEFNAEIPNGAVHLGVAQQKLDGA